MEDIIMHTESIRTLALAWIAAAGLLASACGDDSDPAGSADSTSGQSTTTTASTGNTVSATGQVDTTAAVDETSASTGMADGSFLDPDTSGGGPLPQGNGAQCADNTECASELCYQIPMLGGVCSECLDDSDCATGTCSLDPAAGYAVCTDGSIGMMCSSDEGCMGDLICAQLLDTGGLFELNFCSECDDSTPCQGGQVCAPVYDLGNFQGYLACMNPGSVPNGQGCPLDGAVGNGEVCQSGLCGVASVFDLLPIGICGECLTDVDCMGMATCTPPVADMMGLQGAVCM